MVLFSTLFVYVISFVAIWFGAGLIIQSVDRIAHKLRLSSFTVSFFILGLLTSIPETAVGINAVFDHTPEVFVGNLLGGTMVIFLFIIPLLAVLGKGVKLSHDLSSRNQLRLLAVIAAPGFVMIDHRATNLEGFCLIALYAIIFYSIQKQRGFLGKKQVKALSAKAYSFIDLAKVVVGIIIVYVSSQYIVSQTLAFAEMFHISAFYISLIVLSLGTNLPELSIAIRAIISGKKDIAFGDYLGSAAANTLLFGIFTLLNDGEVITINSFIVMFILIITGLGLFYVFSQSKNEISRREGLILMAVYVAFMIFEIFRGLATKV